MLSKNRSNLENLASRLSYHLSLAGQFFIFAGEQGFEQRSKHRSVVRNFKMQKFVHNHLGALAGWLAKELSVKGQPPSRRTARPFSLFTIQLDLR